jgi:hypothetical protein
MAAALTPTLAMVFLFVAQIPGCYEIAFEVIRDHIFRFLHGGACDDLHAVSGEHIHCASAHPAGYNDSTTHSAQPGRKYARLMRGGRQSLRSHDFFAFDIDFDDCKLPTVAEVRTEHSIGGWDCDLHVFNSIFVFLAA